VLEVVCVLGLGVLLLLYPVGFLPRVLVLSSGALVPGSRVIRLWARETKMAQEGGVRPRWSIGLRARICFASRFPNIHRTRAQLAE
jgi:hypothetical protein